MRYRDPSTVDFLGGRGISDFGKPGWDYRKSRFYVPMDPPAAPPAPASSALDYAKDFASDYLLKPAQGLLSAGSAAAGGLAGLAAAALGSDAYQRALDENASGLDIGPGDAYNPLTAMRVAPGPGHVLSEAFAPGEQDSAPARIGKRVGALVGDIALDPMNWATGGLAATSKLGKFARTGERVVEELAPFLKGGAEAARTLSRGEAAGRAATAALGSASAGLVYAPDIVQGTLSEGQQAAQAFRQGDYGAAAEHGVGAALTGALGGATLYGVRHDFKTAPRTAAQPGEVGVSRDEADAILGLKPVPPPAPALPQVFDQAPPPTFDRTGPTPDPTTVPGFSQAPPPPVWNAPVPQGFEAPQIVGGPNPRPDMDFDLQPEPVAMNPADVQAERGFLTPDPAAAADAEQARLAREYMASRGTAGLGASLEQAALPPAAPRLGDRPPDPVPIPPELATVSPRAAQAAAEVGAVGAPTPERYPGGRGLTEASTRDGAEVQRLQSMVERIPQGDLGRRLRFYQRERMAESARVIEDEMVRRGQQAQPAPTATTYDQLTPQEQSTITTAGLKIGDVNAMTVERAREFVAPLLNRRAPEAPVEVRPETFGEPPVPTEDRRSDAVFDRRAEEPSTTVRPKDDRRTRGPEDRRRIAEELQVPEDSVAVDRFMAERQRADEADVIANTDPKTGLKNARGWDRVLKTVNEDTDSVVTIDLKGFKETNDRIGHKAGDEVLASVGGLVRKHFGDESARPGGDEFNAVMRNVGEEGETRAAAFREELRALKIQVKNPVTGELLDIPFMDAHIGIGRDADESDLAQNIARDLYGSGRKAEAGAPPGERPPVQGTAGETGPGLGDRPPQLGEPKYSAKPKAPAAPKDDTVAIMRNWLGDESRPPSFGEFNVFDRETAELLAGPFKTRAEAEAAAAAKGLKFKPGNSAGPKYGVRKAAPLDPDSLPREVLSRMNQHLKAKGFDVRGADDVKGMLKTGRVFRDGQFTHEDWRAAYEAATGTREARKTKAKTTAETTPHVDWKGYNAFPITSNPKKAGYIKPSGSLVDMSYGEAQRADDHRIVGGTAGMQELVAAGHIRWMPEGNGLDIGKEPTPQQYRQIRDLVDRADGEVVLDLADGLGEFDAGNKYYRNAPRETNLEFPKGTRAEKVIGQIRRFYAGEDIAPGVKYDAAGIPEGYRIEPGKTPGYWNAIGPDGKTLTSGTSAEQAKARLVDILRPHGIDIDTVQRAFPSGKVEDAGDGTWKVALPHDRSILVRVEPTGIAYNSRAMKFAHPEAGESHEAAGVWQKIPAGGVIRLAKAHVSEGVLGHEVFHSAMSLVLTPKEQAAVLRRFEPEARANYAKGGEPPAKFDSLPRERRDALAEEAAADAYGTWKPSETNTLFSKIAEFFRRIYHSFKPSWESAFKEVRSGKAFERAGETTDGDVKFATAPKTPPAPEPERKLRPIPPTPEQKATYAAGKAEGGRDTGQPPAEFVNLDRASSDEDIRKLVSRVADARAKEQGEAKSYRSWEEAREKAVEAGITEADFKRMVKEGAVSDHVIEAGRMLRTDAFKSVQENLRALNEAAKEGKETADLEAAYESAINKAAGVLWSTTRAGAEAGRALAIHRKLAEGLTDQERLYRKIAKGRPGLSEGFARRVLATDTNDSAALAALIRSEFTPSKRSMAYEFWINGLLSGPPTHIANAIGNTLSQLGRIGEKAVAGGIDAARVAVFGGERERFVGEAMADIQGIKEGLPKAMRAFSSSWNDELLAFREEGKVEYSPKIPGQAGKVIRTPTRLLSASDQFAKAIVETREARALAYRKARMEGKTGDQIAQRMAEILGDLDAHPDIAKGMAAEADYQTFTKTVGKFGQMLRAARDSDPTGFAKVVVPFFNTPLNIAKYTLERTPLNFIRIAAMAKNGELKGGALSEELAKATTGTMIGVGLAMMAHEGLITGGGPADPKENETKRKTGWAPYSLHVGDQYISFQRLEPFSSIAGFAADMVEAKDEKTTGDLVDKIVGSVAENLTNKTFLQGLENAFLMWSDPKRYASQWAKNLEGSAVPAIFGRAAQAIDPTFRETSAFDGSAIAARIPGVSTLLQPKRSGTGEPVERGGSAAERFLSPAPRTFEKGPEADLERVFLEIDYVPSRPAKSVTVPGSGGKKVELTDSEYREFQKADERITQRLRKMVADPRFRRMSTEAQRKLIKSRYELAGDDARRRVLPTVLKRFRQSHAGSA